MPATVIVGAQWGDEGKGKIVDLLAQHSDLVCRYQGGPNAGHTIIADGETYKLHHIPSGILYPGTLCVLGAGCVIDPQVLIRELDELEARGVSTGDIRISPNAHLIMPWHVALDQASERRLGKLQIGTTRRGIGPTYADKHGRIGIRVQDLLDEKILRQKIEIALAEKNVWLERVYGAEPLTLEDVLGRSEGWVARLEPYVADTSLLVDLALRRGSRVLLEGGQGTLLDVDHGTYPFVTSSNSSGVGIASGSGVPGRYINHCIGVVKAYSTRVGGGPFPTEQDNATGQYLRERGNEYGTVTRRPRRCGWLDVVALRYTSRLSGIDSIAVMLLDVLSGVDEIKVCTAYTIDGKSTTRFPSHVDDLRSAKPVYESLPGWKEEITGCRSYADLPENAKAYLRRISELVGPPVEMVSVGPERDQTIAVSKV